jgi:N-acetylglucosamine-6-sulfatase
MDRVRHTRASSHVRLPIAAALSALLCALVLSAGQASAVEPEEAPLNPNPEPPSFVVIQTDDQTLDGLYATFSAFPGAAKTRAMPNTLDLIGGHGMTFNRYYVPYPLCCPSRVSLLTGRYAHNTGVKGNVQPNGGYYGFSFRAAASHNLATWLQGSGYRTIHIGKFLNGYGDEPYDNGTAVPPGWDAWHTMLKADTNHYFYGYTLNNNGELSAPYGESGDWETREYGERDPFGCPFEPLEERPCTYATDVFNWMAREEMLATPPEQPFYLQLDYTAPHGDFRRPAGPEPALRHYDWFKGARLPHDRSEGFDEGNVADKPRFIRDAEHLTPNDKRTYRVYYEKQLDSLRAIDDGVKEVVDTLGQLHRLRNTYILFVSDNGFFFGEHRLIGGKFLAYEPATHLPFLIRGPGIEQGSSTGELAANIDIAPTILALAGVEADKSIDGRSLIPFLRDPELRSRRPVLFESFVETSDVEANGAITSTARSSGAHASLLAPPKDYEGIRLGPYKYIAWPTGEKELYDINKDPNELNNIAKVPNFYPIRNFLHRQLRRFENCSGRECREVTPPLPLTRVEANRLRAQRQKEIREKEREREKERREHEREKQHP